MWSLILYVVCSMYVRSMYVVCVCMYVVFCKIDHCIHIHWCIVMGLGHNDPWVESHMWPQQTWGQRSSRGQWPLVQVFGKKGQCIHILWCIFKSIKYYNDCKSMWSRKQARLVVHLCIIVGWYSCLSGMKLEINLWKFSKISSIVEYIILHKPFKVSLSLCVQWNDSTNYLYGLIMESNRRQRVFRNIPVIELSFPVQHKCIKLSRQNVMTSWVWLLLCGSDILNIR